MRVRSLVVAAVVLVSSGCSSATPTPPPPSCPQDLPAVCPSPPPSYKNDVVDILDARCNRCHGTGGNAADKPLTDYESVYRLRSGVLNQVYACHMPPAADAQLSSAQRKTLLEWLICHSPDN